MSRVADECAPHSPKRLGLLQQARRLPLESRRALVAQPRDAVEEPLAVVAVALPREEPRGELDHLLDRLDRHELRASLPHELERRLRLNRRPDLDDLDDLLGSGEAGQRLHARP